MRTSPNMPSDRAPPTGGGYVVAARHAERLDYVLRDAGSNWLSLPLTDRPWDPPLSEPGRDQAIDLGRRVRRALRGRGLPPVTAVYASPLIRCCQTAVGAIEGLAEGGGDGDGVGDEGDESGGPLRIRVEHGLVECLNEKWYRSWSLPGSDGTWGYRPPGPPKDGGGSSSKGGEEGTSSWNVDEETLHPNATFPVQDVLSSPGEVAALLGGHARATKGGGERDGGGAFAAAGDVVDLTYAESLHPIVEPYRWGNFEPRRAQMDRMESVAAALADRHPGETVLLVSHGGPITHMYERLTGKHWSVHGVSGYASFSVYSHREGEEEGEVEGDGRGDGPRRRGRRWTEEIVNNCTHVVKKGSGEYQSGKD